MINSFFQKLTVLVLVAVLASSPVFAREAESGSNSGSERGSVARSNDDDSSSEVETEHGVEVGDDSSARRSSKLEDKRSEVQSKIDAKKAAVSAKLDDKRKDVCERRTDNINSILRNSVSRSQRHFEKFQAIESRVISFYESNRQPSTEYSAKKSDVEDKKLAAEAAITAANSTSFVCNEANPSDVSGVVRQAIEEKNNALKSYRTALKELISVVKQSAPKEGSSNE